MEIIWKDIPGFENKYQVSSDAQIRSLTKNCFSRTIVRKEPKIIKQLITKDGNYLAVGLRKMVDGKSKMHTKKVHVLFSKAFIPNPLMKPFVNHKDGNKHNNNIENLEWVTSSENNQHAYDTGLRKARSGRSPKAMFTDDQVRDIRDSKLCEKDLSIKHLCKVSTIKNILNRKHYKDVL